MEILLCLMIFWWGHTKITDFAFFVQDFVTDLLYYLICCAIGKSVLTEYLFNLLLHLLWVVFLCHWESIHMSKAWFFDEQTFRVFWKPSRFLQLFHILTLHCLFLRAIYSKVTHTDICFLVLLCLWLCQNFVSFRDLDKVHIGIAVCYWLCFLVPYREN